MTTGLLRRTNVASISKRMWLRRSLIWDPSLVLYLPLWNDKFISLDYNQHVCTNSGSVLVPNRGRSFDGSGDGINCGNAAALQVSTALTILAWIKIGTPASNLAVVARRQTNDNYQFFTNVTPKFGFTYWVAGVEKTGVSNSNTALVAGTWALIGITHDATNDILYLNGTSDKSAAAGGNLDTNATATTVGALNTAWVQSFNGVIGEVLQYNRALSAGEMMRNHQATKWRYQ